MEVLVSDTSILIDLERGELLEQAFTLSHTFMVPDLLYKRELLNDIGPALMALGLTVAELDGDQVSRAQDYQRQTPKISLPDAFALSLAKTSGCVLLTGDQELRRLATDEAVTCHGLLWLLDVMNHEGAASCAALFHGLCAIAAHPRCRLPKPEIRARQKDWAATAGIAIDE